MEFSIDDNATEIIIKIGDIDGEKGTVDQRIENIFGQKAERRQFW